MQEETGEVMSQEMMHDNNSHDDRSIPESTPNPRRKIYVQGLVKIRKKLYRIQTNQIHLVLGIWEEGDPNK